VEVVGARSSKGKQQQLVPPDKVNINGAVRDQDTFILGDDDEDEDEDGEAPPPYLEQTSSQAQEPDLSENSGSPHEYLIQPSDTLHGIALRFGVDGRELCRLNNLPPSTLNITPHLLHTRTVLTLPPSARLNDRDGNSLLPSGDKQRAVRRTRERAEKRLQTITKEVDWRVAKAYVALAEDEDLTQYDLKRKEMHIAKATTRDSSLDQMALDGYLEDNEWEARERREGRYPLLTKDKKPWFSLSK